MKNLLTVTGALGAMMLTSLPIYAVSFTNPGGNITLQADSNFTFNVTGVSNPSTVRLTIASLSSSTFLGGLSVYLRSPSNSQTLLLAQGLTDGGFTNVTFRDSGTSTIDTAIPPYTGTFLAFDSFSDTEALADISNFAGFNVADGEWTLLVRSANSSGIDTIGTLSLNIEPVPFEFSPVAGIVGLGAVWAFKQARKKK